MSRFAFGLRYFLFALGSALNTRSMWSGPSIWYRTAWICAALSVQYWSPRHTLTCPN